MQINDEDLISQSNTQSESEQADIQKSLINNNETLVNLNKIQKRLTLDDFLQKVGTEHWFQIRTFACFCLQGFCVSWFYTAQKYFFIEPEFICPANSPVSGTCEQQLCYLYPQNSPNRFSSIKNYIDTTSFYSASIEFDMLCENSYMREVMMLVQPCISLIGILFFGYLSDNDGRSYALKICWRIFTLGSILFPFVSTFPLFAIGYNICAFSCMSAIFIQVSLVNEQTTGKVREYASAGLWLMFVVGQFLYVALAYIIDNWRYLSFATLTIPVLCLNFLQLVYFESARFYYPQNKLQAIQTLNKIALVNKKQYLNIDLKLSTWMEEWKQIKRNMLDLFQYPTLKMCTIYGFIIMFTCHLQYYGSEEPLFNLEVSPFAQTLIIYGTKFIGFGIATITITKLKRKFVMKFITLIVLAFLIIFLIIVIFVNQQTISVNSQFNSFSDYMWVDIILISIIRIGASFTICVCFVYYSELFPTSVRSIGMSTVFSANEIAFILNYSLWISNNYVVSIGIMLVFAIGIYFLFEFLPETKGKNLKDEIEEEALAQHDLFYIRDK